MNTYTKMCNCPEIQSRWKPKVGDICCATERSHSNYKDEICIVDKIIETQGTVLLSLFGVSNKMVAAWFYPEKNIWLPRQEDTQTLLAREEKFKDNYGTMMGGLYGFMITYHRTQVVIWWKKPGILTELWLAFYMHEIHNKRWTDKGWM